MYLSGNQKNGMIAEISLFCFRKLFAFDLKKNLNLKASILPADPDLPNKIIE
jgi:hypothetical protein